MFGIVAAGGTYYLLSNHFYRTRTLRHRVINGIKNDHFYCDYQPIVDINTGKFLGVEVLARFGDKHGNVSPLDFIPIIAQENKSYEFTKFVFGQALRELEAYSQSDTRFKVNFNVFPEDFPTQQLWDCIYQQASHYPQFDIVIEITEDQAIDAERSKRFTSQAQQCGIAIAIDDFGTGYANLNNLQELKYDYLKIDRSFVKGLENDSIVSSLIPNIVDIANKFDMTIVAEGVETPEQQSALAELGVQQAQGWLFSKPMSAKALSQYLT